jgi:hypothetical protein
MLHLQVITAWTADSSITNMTYRLYRGSVGPRCRVMSYNAYRHLSPSIRCMLCASDQLKLQCD